jgi:hypothetical protein
MGEDDDGLGRSATELADADGAAGQEPELYAVHVSMVPRSVGIVQAIRA